ncbi:hypothetical protein C900_01623 [Fulvivirga imtechensis AK7]|uniref:Uncharacterized protein n=1 Tax=Fulvivirga imtechensis AK7 TaxID=1237149 RepID=L8JTN1_9BACT|nr:hypothetical protein [Fulvivirga imtechensis]ELR72341.1 hypothetical protein C900_01623 [Fulvivirga imtechensis AK7]
MDTIIINIINPKVRKLLEDLEALNLISIARDDKSFKALVTKLRNKDNPKPTFDEITKEVEKVRAKGYGKEG